MSGSKIRLYGSTSGFVELEAPAVGDDQTLVLPTASSGGFGGLVAVKHVALTNRFTASSVAAGASVAVTGLSLTHEVADAANRLIISAVVNASNSGSLGEIAIAVFDGTNFLTVGDAGTGSQPRVTSGGHSFGTASVAAVAFRSFEIVHTPGTGSKTYTVYIFNTRDGARTLYVNRTVGNSDSANHPVSVSTLMLQEVRV